MEIEEWVYSTLDRSLPHCMRHGLHAEWTQYIKSQEGGEDAAKRRLLCIMQELSRQQFIPQWPMGQPSDIEESECEAADMQAAMPIPPSRMSVGGRHVPSVGSILGRLVPIDQHVQDELRDFTGELFEEASVWLHKIAENVEEASIHDGAALGPIVEAQF